MSNVTAERFFVHEPSLTQLENDTKTLEVRIGTANVKRLRVGDCVTFTNNRAKRFTKRIVAIRRYRSFAEMLKKEPLEKIAPHLPVADSILEVLRRFYTSTLEQRLGVYILELVPVD